MGSVPEGVIPDPVAVEKEMSRRKYRTKAQRKIFWRGHAAHIRAALAEAGLTRDEINALVDKHRLDVGQVHQNANPGKRKPSARERKRVIDCDEPPPVGTEIVVSGKRAVLIAVEPYVRKITGEATFLLKWNVEGRIGTTGLRSNSISWRKEDTDVA